MIVDRQTHTHRQTHTLITILRFPVGGGVIIGDVDAFRSLLIRSAVSYQTSLLAPPSALSVTLPTFAAERRRGYVCSTEPAARQQLSIDICLSPRRSAANPSAAIAAVDQWGRQTDGQTDVRPLRRLHSACIQHALSTI